MNHAQTPADPHLMKLLADLLKQVRSLQKAASAMIHLGTAAKANQKALGSELSLHMFRDKKTGKRMVLRGERARAICEDMDALSWATIQVNDKLEAACTNVNAYLAPKLGQMERGDDGPSMN